MFFENSLSIKKADVWDSWSLECHGLRRPYLLFSAVWCPEQGLQPPCSVITQSRLKPLNLDSESRWEAWEGLSAVRSWDPLCGRCCIVLVRFCLAVTLTQSHLSPQSALHTKSCLCSLWRACRYGSKEGMLATVSAESALCCLKSSCEPLNWLCSPAVIIPTFGFQPSFLFSQIYLHFHLSKVILCLPSGLWHNREGVSSSFLILLLNPSVNCSSFKADALGAWSPASCPVTVNHRALSPQHCSWSQAGQYQHLYLDLLCPVISCSAKAFTPTDDITFKISISTLHYNFHFSFLFLALCSSTWTLLFTPTEIYSLSFPVTFFVTLYFFTWLILCSTLKPFLCLYSSTFYFPNLMLWDSTSSNSYRLWMST